MVVVRIGYFPTGVKAPEMTIPEGLPGMEALAYARQNLQALDAAASRCEARFGSTAWSPIIRSLVASRAAVAAVPLAAHVAYAKRIAALRRGSNPAPDTRPAAMFTEAGVVVATAPARRGRSAAGPPARAP